MIRISPLLPASSSNALDAEKPAPLSRKGSMSLFMLGKTYHWVSKAKIAAWFRIAFQVKDGFATGKSNFKCSTFHPKIPGTGEMEDDAKSDAVGGCSRRSSLAQVSSRRSSLAHIGGGGRFLRSKR